MSSTKGEEEELEGRQNALPADFPYVRAWVVTGTGCIMYMLSYISIIPVVSQYVVKRLNDDLVVSNFTNTTSNESNPCNGTVLGPQRIAVQTEAANLTLYYSLLSSVAAIAINLFMGPLSDVVGRRVLFVFPLFGIFFKSVFISMIVYFELDLNFLYLAYGIDGLCGSFYAILVATMAYTADITRPGKNRTIAIAIMEGCLAIAASSGVLLSGFLIKWKGYFYPMLMFALFAAVDFLVVFCLLPETLREKKKGNKSPIYNLKMVFGFYFTEGTLHKRFIYTVLMLTFSFSVVTVLGRSTLETIYQLGEPFCWDSVKIGSYIALRISLQIVCSIIALKVLQAWLRDETISIISSLSAGGGFILEALANTGTMMFLVPVAGIMGSSSVPIARSLLSQMTPRSRQGALFASIAIIESVCGSASNSLYNLVYNATVSQFRGAVWFMMAGICIVNIGILLVYICLSRSIFKTKTIVETSVNEKSTDRHDIF